MQSFLMQAEKIYERWKEVKRGRGKKRETIINEDANTHMFQKVSNLEI